MTELVNILSHTTFDSKERFFFGCLNSSGHFFQSLLHPKDFDHGFKLHNLFCPNSFIPKARIERNLKTIYALWVDLDGWDSPFPLSHYDILRRCRELGLEEPSLIIQTSLGRYHIIFQLLPLRAFPEKRSYWKKVATGLAKCFKDFGCDIGATTNPVGFIRIPGHQNFKYPDRPVVEAVFQSNVVFTLSEIHQVLLDNGVIKKPKTKTTNEPNSVKEKINQLLEHGVSIGKRARAALSLAIHFNKYRGLTQESTLEKLLNWNTNVLVEPLNTWEVRNAVSSAYKHGYGLSMQWLEHLTQDSDKEIQDSYERAKVTKKKPLRTSLIEHGEKIKTHILSNRGFVEVSQRQLAKELSIPWRSYIEAVKQMPELEITVIGKGRNAKSNLRITQQPKLKLAL